MSGSLPESVRYVKIGEGGQWWTASKSRQQVHLGWGSVSPDLLMRGDLVGIEAAIRADYGAKRGATQDFNGLRSLLLRPSRHIWITFQEGYLWWCTVRDGVHVNPHGKSKVEGHFWLVCARPWSNRSLGGRLLAMADLPGIVTRTAGYRATTCEPASAGEILRILRDEKDPDHIAMEATRASYEEAVARLIARLGDRDFELLIDLILARTGWVRLAKLGGTTEGIDIEIENPAVDEIAFVQVKSTASQDVLDDYVRRFAARRERYQRMIFAVHTLGRPLIPPDDKAVQVWTGPRISSLVVKLGLGDWVASRL